MFQLFVFIAFSLSGAAVWILRARLIQERRKNTALEAELNELKRLLRFRARLASEIAHEIKNPITAILCSAETLELLISDKLDENQRLTLRYIKEYGDNLHKLLSDFLDLSKSEGGQMQCNLQRVELSKAIQSIIGLLEAFASRKSVSVTNHLESKNLYVMADPLHLKQVLFNLLHNAIKYTPKGGAIAVNCSGGGEKSVIVSVEDTGPGIPAERIAKLFDPYSKFEEKRDETVIITEAGVPLQGSGIGLALCKSLMELQGGTIWVESREGRGSIFSFSLAGISGAKAPDPERKESSAIHPTFQDLAQSDH